MTYDEAMCRFGSDKPDTRFAMELIDVSELAAESDFRVFAGAIENGGVVQGLCVKGEAENYSRKAIDGLTKFVADYGARGLAWAKITAEGVTGSISKFYADAAGAGDEGGLRRLIDCLALEVQLCNLIGHSRPEEGSEHYFAYAAESILGHGLPHGDLVGPGILVMAALQGQDTRSLRRALVACHTPLDTIPAEVIERTLRGLPHYCRAHDLPHGIAHDITDDMVSSAMSALPL